MENTQLITISGQHNELTVHSTFENTEHAALAYAEAGLSVLPVKQDKSPAVSSWKEFTQTIPSSKSISDWYSTGTNGVGIICGAISGNLECLDIDEKYNVDSPPLIDHFESLSDIQISGLLSRLVHETSQNGGHHLVYRCSTIERSKKLAVRPATESELKEKPKEKAKVLIETRGEGAYFACYPTPGYKLVSGSFTDIPEITEQERKVLLECARAMNQYTKEEKTITGYPTKRNASIVRPGDDFNLRGDITTVLREAGWQYSYTLGQTQYWRRPGKTSGISASFNNRPNMFYVFTSNGDPLEPLTWYTKFALLACLKYNGDFFAAAQDLAEEGYGDTTVSKAESFLNHRYEFRYNVVTGRIEYRDKTCGNYAVLQDYDLNSICRELEYSHIKVSPDRLAGLLRSNYSMPFDPFKEYYEGLPVWDGKIDYIAHLAQTVQLKNTAEQPLFEEYLRKWLVGAVGCAIDPDIANHNCLILVGPQGYYKTTWLNKLVPESLLKYLHVGTIDPADKDTLIHLSECFMINLDELETLNKHELGSLKSIMTMKESRIRRPYGHFADQLIRRASFVGSINKDSFLNDETGSRRFLVFEIASIDADHTVDIDKVHSQAYSLFKSGFRHWFDKGEITTVNDRNKEFAVQTTEDELVAQYCMTSQHKWMTATQVAQEISENTSYQFGKSSARDFGFALKKAGYASKKLDGITRYGTSVGCGFQLHPPSSGVKRGVESGEDVPENVESDSF